LTFETVALLGVGAADAAGIEDPVIEEVPVILPTLSNAEFAAGLVEEGRGASSGLFKSSAAADEAEDVAAAAVLVIGGILGPEVGVTALPVVGYSVSPEAAPVPGAVAVVLGAALPLTMPLGEGTVAVAFVVVAVGGSLIARCCWTVSLLLAGCFCA